MASTTISVTIFDTFQRENVARHRINIAQTQIHRLFSNSTYLFIFKSQNTLINDTYNNSHFVLRKQPISASSERERKGKVVQPKRNLCARGKSETAFNFLSKVHSWIVIANYFPSANERETLRFCPLATLSSVCFQRHSRNGVERQRRQQSKKTDILFTYFSPPQNWRERGNWLMLFKVEGDFT